MSLFPSAKLTSLLTSTGFTANQLPLQHSLAAFLKNAPTTFNCSYNDNTSCQIALILASVLCANDTSLTQSIFSEISDATPKNLAYAREMDLLEDTNTQTGKPCGHVFKKGEGVYRCRDCAFDDTCVLCSKCYHASSHDGHDVSFTVNGGSGGCCDCGDPEAWKLPVNCRYHAPTNSNTSSTSPSSSSKNTSTPHHGPSGKAYNAIPPPLLSNVRNTLRTVMDFTLETFYNSPEDIQSALIDAEAIEKEAKMIGRQLGYEEEKRPLYAVVLWNDENHTFVEVIDRIMRAAGTTRDVAKKMAEDVDAHGRCVVQVSPSLTHMLEVARVLNSIGLAVTVRSARDTFREQMSYFLLIWIKDLATGRRATGSIPNVNVDFAVAFRELISEMFCEEWSYTQRQKLRRRSTLSESNQSATSKKAKTLQDRGNETISELRGAEDVDVTVGEASPAAESDIEMEIAEVYGTKPSSQTTASPLSDATLSGTERHDPDAELDELSTLPADEDKSIQNPCVAETETVTTKDYIKAAKSCETQNIHAIAPLFDEENVLGEMPTESNASVSAVTPIIEEPEPRSTNTISTSKSHKRRDQSSLKQYEKLNANLRLDWYLVFDVRMWRDVRTCLKELYIGTLVTSAEYKKTLGIRFARNYIKLAEAFLVADREPENSIILFSVQLFTVPTISHLLAVKYDFVNTLLAILRAFFMSETLTTTPTVEMLNSTGTPRIVNCESASFRNRRHFHVFHDLRYIISSPQVRKYIVRDPLHLKSFLELIGLMQGMNANKRLTQSHVEYENEIWVNAFNVSLHVAKSCRQFAKAFGCSSSKALGLAVRAVMRRIDSWMKSGSEENPNPSTELHGSQFVAYTASLFLDTPHREFRLPQFDVAFGYVSFHHPLHWFLAQLLQNTHLLDDESLKETGWKRGFKQMAFGFENKDIYPASQRTATGSSDKEGEVSMKLLHMFDYPIRVLVLLCQIRAGLWVRNGFGIRSQAHHYREVSLREKTHDQDIFLVQAALVLLDPEDVIVMIAARFDLLDWLSCETRPHERYDDQQRVFLAEEFWALLITLASERMKPSGARIFEEIRRELIHFLALGPVAYSELYKKIPERLVENEHYDAVLSQVATFRPPDGMTDVGVYELKDECYEEVDPYFFHYSRNNREEAEEVLKSRAKRQMEKHKQGDPNASSSVLPTPRIERIQNGPFVRLGQFLQTRMLVQFVFGTLWQVYAQKEGNHSDTLVEECIHLMLLALLDPNAEPVSVSGSEQCHGFAAFACSDRYAVNLGVEPTLLRLIFLFAVAPEFKPHHDRLNMIISLLEERALSTGRETIQEWRTHHTANSTQPAQEQERERKKAAAKARQAKIMSEFAQAQKSFQMNNSELYNEMEGLEDDEMGVEGDGDMEMDAEDGLGGKGKTADQEGVLRPFPTGRCIVCQEDTESDKTHLYGMLAFIQPSNLLRQTPVKDADFIWEAIDAPTSLDRDHQSRLNVPAPGPGPGKGFPFTHYHTGLNASSCGHLMHLKCFDSYFDSLEQRHLFQSTRSHPEDVEKREFLCPLCKSLGNVLLPILWKGRKEGPIDHHENTFGPIDHSLSRAVLDSWIENSLILSAQTMIDQTEVETRATRIRDMVDQGNLSASVSPPPPESPAMQRRGSGSTARLRNAISNFVHDIFGSPHDDSSDDDAAGTSDEPVPSTEAIRTLYSRLTEAIHFAYVNYYELDEEPNPEFNNDVSLTAEMLADTIAFAEIFARGTEPSASSSSTTECRPGTWLDGVSSLSLLFMQVLSKTVLTYASMSEEAEIQIEKIRTGVSARLLQLVCGLRPSNKATPSVRPLFLGDPFHLFVEMSMYAAPLLKLQPHHLLKILFVADITKTIVVLASSVLDDLSKSTNGDDEEGPTTLLSSYVTGSHWPSDERVKGWKPAASEQDENMDADRRQLVEFAGFVLRRVDYTQAQVDRFFEAVDGSLLLRLVQSYGLPFLRKSAALLHVRFGVVFAPSATDASDTEFNRLTRQLYIPPIRELCKLESNTSSPTEENSQGLQRLVSGWCRHFSIYQRLGDSAEVDLHAANIVSLNHPTMFDLIKLPARLDQLFEASLREVCRNCETVPASPAYCMVCGTVVCSQSFCCTDDDVGECNLHMRRCTGEVGIFLLVKKCVILLLHNENGCFMNAPYLDTHGEVDLGLRRGRPQFLSMPRFQLIRKLWLGHGIAVQVARKIEQSFDLGGWITL